MKYQSILYSLLVCLPIGAFAHPGHETGTLAFGIPAVFLSNLLALAGLGVAFAAIRACRRRKAPRADG